MSKDYITIRMPTMDKNKAVHTLDMCVQLFNHWYGGSIEYDLEVTSWDGVPKRTFRNKIIELSEVSIKLQESIRDSDDSYTIDKINEDILKIIRD